MSEKKFLDFSGLKFLIQKLANKFSPIDHTHTVSNITDINTTVADWGQEDNTQLDYIKNKTHYFALVNGIPIMRVENVEAKVITLVQDCTDIWNSTIKENYSSESIVKRPGDEEYYGDAIQYSEMTNTGMQIRFVSTIGKTVTKIDETNFALSGNTLPTDPGTCIYIIYDLTTLTEEYKNYFTVPGVYYRGSSYLNGVEILFGRYNAIDDEYLSRNILRARSMVFSDEEKEIVRNNIGAASKDSTDEAILKLQDYISSSTIPKIQNAEVGQTIVVKAVDESGKPTEWETIDRLVYEEEQAVDVVPEQTVTFSDGSASLTDFKDPCYELNLVSDPGGPLAAILVINDEVIEGELNYYFVATGTFGGYSVNLGAGTIALGDGTSVSDGDTVTVRLYILAEQIKTIETKYLPDCVPKIAPTEAGMVPLSVGASNISYECVDLTKYILSTNILNNSGCYINYFEFDSFDTAEILFEDFSASNKIAILLKNFMSESEATDLCLSINDPIAIVGSNTIQFSGFDFYNTNKNILITIDNINIGYWHFQLYELSSLYTSPKYQIIQTNSVISKISLRVSDGRGNYPNVKGAIELYGI